MKSNEKMNIPINIVLYITAIGIILGTIIFVYNTIEMQNIEIIGAEQTDEENNTPTEENENIEIAKTETQTISTRTTMNERENQEQQTDKSISEQKEEKVYTQIKDVKISKDMDLTVNTNVSKEDFKTLISEVKQDKSKFFYENSDFIYDLCYQYQLNEIFFCGLISAESGWNIADNHRRTHNYISLMSKGNLIKYNSVEEGLEVAAKTLHNKYLTKGGVFYYGKTLSAVKTKFCPASNTWVNLVYGRMKQIIK